MAAANGGDPFSTPGFRFYPTEEELLCFYLRRRLAGASPAVERVIPVVDVYSYHPSQLRPMAGEASARDTEQWFFFCPRAEREVHGGRPARTTPSGYWKATGSPSCVFSSGAGRVVGVKRTMVFYQGRAPTGSKTRWKMNEYKAVADDDVDAGGAAVTTAPPKLRNELSLCRVYISTGTLRSFDRRPLNPSGGHAQDHHLRHHNHQAESSSTATAANAHLAAGAGQAIPSSHHTENSHDSSSSGSPGVIAGDDVGEDAAIDWSSLIAAADDFGFSDMGFSSSSTAAWPQI